MKNHFVKHFTENLSALNENFNEMVLTPRQAMDPNSGASPGKLTQTPLPLHWDD
jgi:hypothetical protein